MQIKIFDRGKGFEVTAGHVTGHVFSKLVKPENIMMVTNSIGIQEEAIEKIKALNVELIVCTEDTPEGAQHWATLQTWLEKGMVENDGHGLQRFLNLRFMKNSRTDLVEQKGMF